MVTSVCPHRRLRTQKSPDTRPRSSIDTYSPVLSRTGLTKCQPLQARHLARTDRGTAHEDRSITWIARSLWCWGERENVNRLWSSLHHKNEGRSGQFFWLRRAARRRGKQFAPRRSNLRIIAPVRKPSPPRPIRVVAVGRRPRVMDRRRRLKVPQAERRLPSARCWRILEERKAEGTAPPAEGRTDRAAGLRLRTGG